MASRAYIALSIIACTSGCSEERAPPATVPLVTWVADVAPVVASRCAACHTGAAAAGGYELGSYLGALGVGTDSTANAIAGDPGSAILTRLDGADGVHVGLDDVAVVLTAWVVDSRLAYRDSAIHDPGLLNPVDPGFHGAELAARGWDFPLCQSCHGADYAGGASAASCLTCHANGPTACDTCHGDVPASGAHHPHVDGGALARPVGCDECHRVPATWDEPGHILAAGGGVDPPPAEVALGPLAARDVVPPRRTMPAAYDPTTSRCSAVYCHGDILGDPAATDPAPRWTDGAAASTCGACHGTPPTDHVQGDCATCHPGTIAANGGLAAGHLDGELRIGDGAGTCTGCHGSAGNPAPPRGLHGEILPSTVAVGAHRAHLEASGLRGPMPCAECHVVPAALGDAGHIDSAPPAEVFAPGSGALAGSDNANPSWNRADATCAGVYCHGNGDGLAANPSPGVRTPIWTEVGGGQVYCGSCHGLPPPGPFHILPMTIGDCATCHPGVDGFGNIILTGPPGAETSEHIDGVVDLL